MSKGNAGCDKCGVNDRVGSSKLCGDCLAGQFEVERLCKQHREALDRFPATAKGCGWGYIEVESAEELIKKVRGL